jgi:signal transduction histidine kinase
MKNKINILLLIGIVLVIIVSFNTYLTYKSVNIEKTKLELLQTDIKIKQETFLGNLVSQYHLDLQDCLDFISKNPQLSKEKCIEEMNQSYLAEKIREWGGEKYLETIDVKK